MSECPCGSGRYYTACCGRFIDDGASPATAEELMRARYTAYATGNVEYVLNTHDPKTRESVSEEATKEWSQSAHWLGLKILHTDAGGPKDNRGTVEFVASFEIEGKKVDHHERASFLRHDGKWFFEDGDIVGETHVRDTPKVGRNDPCPCGSGKKYKFCCGRS